jgi:hypothetical protein
MYLSRLSSSILIVLIISLMITSLTVSVSGDREDIVYIAVVIHMNQLIENLNVTEAYGRPIGPVFYNESLIPLKHPGVKLVIDITGPTILSMLATYPSILDNIRKGIESGRVEVLGITFGQIPVQYLPLQHVVKHVYYENLLLNKIFGVKPRGIWQEDR